MKSPSAGMVAGFVCSFLLPSLHDEASVSARCGKALLGMAAGAGIIYAILRAGQTALRPA